MSSWRETVASAEEKAKASSKPCLLCRQLFLTAPRKHIEMQMWWKQSFFYVFIGEALPNFIGNLILPLPALRHSLRRHSQQCMNPHRSHCARPRRGHASLTHCTALSLFPCSLSLRVGVRRGRCRIRVSVPLSRPMPPPHRRRSIRALGPKRSEHRTTSHATSAHASAAIHDGHICGCRQDVEM